MMELKFEFSKRVLEVFAKRLIKETMGLESMGLKFLIDEIQ